MATQELTHVNAFKILFPGALPTNNQVTIPLDTSLPFLNQPGGIGQSVGVGGNQYAEASAIVNLVGAGLTAALNITLILQESHTTTDGDFVDVDPLFCEWFQEGVPGSPGAAGAWVPSIPGAHINNVLLNHANLSSKAYAVSYVGGQLRFIRMKYGVTGAITTTVAACGALSALAETYGRIHTNWIYP